MRAIINSGTGPVVEATAAQAETNMRVFAVDVAHKAARDPAVLTWSFTGKTTGGRFTFVMRCDKRESVIDMPGIATDAVRWMRLPEQNIWDFPRLYVDGSSWVWWFAIGFAVRALFGIDCDEE